MDVSVIIVNYKTSGLIVNCIRSVIEKTEGIDYELIVVDNDSEPDIDKIMQDNFGSLVHVIRLPKNIGFGGANNAGIKIAKGRNIFCLNPDTLLRNNAIAILSDYLDKHDDVGAAGGNLFYGDGSEAQSFGRFYPGIKDELNYMSYSRFGKLLYGKNLIFNFSSNPINVAWISGADLMLKSKVLKSSGLYDEQFFMFYEDVDLCYRIHHLGLRIVSLPIAEIYHLEGRSYHSNPKHTNLVYGTRSYLYILNKYMGKLKRQICISLRTLSYRISIILFRNNSIASEVYVAMWNFLKEEKIF